ncbi:aminomuconate-semialdehyde/2-hydroxymuconate-6-semialdehyde dehydrogenase [Catalinimonas alkaloidigena]|uniref:Aminomuconate-semialdehyde/2-hydroxymuconate-6-semialdehyde dehydrogenase n=1 Tax=Catalinimonas alkaloidigena TaxID=1075417 RepID=A0A1G9EQ48_9BACT|nr:aldehyde dehydrogenase [Catalinimonas alkaloidigena]SDK78161.1 aminomuconate-semialdehyde/2-hydroxymuconate-6-semialdehyde dehydrogenase [Catalinimonas alkaloidigena]
MITLCNYIGGKWREPHTGQYLDDVDPAVDQVFAQVPASGPTDVDDAVAAAQRAFPAWSALPVRERSAWLMQLAEAIEARHETLAQAESRDTGKPLWLARAVDIPRASENFRFFATAMLHFASESHLTDQVALNYTVRSPLGVVGCISPWNLPLYLFTWKIAPALAAGNCVVAKPSEVTPLTAFHLAEICEEIGFPAGVLNIVHGRGAEAGQALVTHPHVAAISFTGGTQTGRGIAAAAAPLFKKLSLELGGKNPNLVFADADLHEAVRESVRAAFTNQGQICLCGSRIFVERALYKPFREAFLQEVAHWQVGDPQDETTKVGAVVSESHFRKVLSYLDLACDEGATVLTGGHSVQVEGRCTKGFFMAPTVLEGLSPQCRTNQEEIFGPVVTLTPFDTEDEAVTWANSTPYGLAAMVWTSDVKRAHRVASALQSGIVWVNCWMLRDLRTPFGGMKQSGVGREGGWEVLRFFTEPKNICLKL